MRTVVLEKMNRYDDAYMDEYLSLVRHEDSSDIFLSQFTKIIVKNRPP